MPEYAYTKVTGKLKDFLGKIRDLGKPPSVTNKWLESIGFKSSNDRSIVSIIRQIRFIDDSNNPTEKWSRYRGANYKQVLVEGIKEGYEDLFVTYPDAQNRTNEELEDFFSTRSTAGKQVISAIVSTFKALCELADFSTAINIMPTQRNIEEESTRVSKSNAKEGVFENQEFTPKLHIDVQIHISPDATPEQIENIFASMAKHIFRLKD